MFKTTYRKITDFNLIFLSLQVVICIWVIVTIALPAAAVSQQTPSANEETSTPGSSPPSNESIALEKEKKKSRYFRFNLAGAFGRFRYKENWGTGNTSNEIGRYQGPGIAAALELGRQRKSGFAFGAQFQVGNFPALDRFSLDSESVAPGSETMKIKYLMIGLVFLHHPVGINNGFYFAIRPGISLMHGFSYSYYFPVPLPGFSAALGYDFFNKAKAHLGVEATVTTIFGRGGEKFDFSDVEVRARLISFGLAFTVAVY